MTWDESSAVARFWRSVANIEETLYDKLTACIRRRLLPRLILTYLQSDGIKNTLGIQIHHLVKRRIRMRTIPFPPSYFRGRGAGEGFAGYNVDFWSSGLEKAALLKGLYTGGEMSAGFFYTVSKLDSCLWAGSVPRFWGHYFGWKGIALSTKKIATNFDLWENWEDKFISLGIRDPLVWQIEKISSGSKYREGEIQLSPLM